MNHFMTALQVRNVSTTRSSLGGHVGVCKKKKKLVEFFGLTKQKSASVKSIQDEEVEHHGWLNCLMLVWLRYIPLGEDHPEEKWIKFVLDLSGIYRVEFFQTKYVSKNLEYFKSLKQDRCVRQELFFRTLISDHNLILVLKTDYHKAIYIF